MFTGDRIISLKLSSSGNVTPNPGLSQQPSREPVSDSLLGNLFQSTSNRVSNNVGVLSLKPGFSLSSISCIYSQLLPRVFLFIFQIFF